MVFKFLDYLQPTHYFRCFNKLGVSVFPKVDALDSALLSQLEVDASYKSTLARDYDLSWRAMQGGYLGDAACYARFEDLPIGDNYRFIRKHFHSVWVFYVLVLRVFSFHNPIKELKGWFGTRTVTRQSVQQLVNCVGWADFESPSISAQPLVSVVIPTLNRYPYLKDVLADFEKQSYKHFEVIIVDQSEPFQKAFYEDFDLNFNIIQQQEKALWLARNTAIKRAKGDLIALSEDDVRIQPDWIAQHLKCLDFFKAEVSAGVFYPEGQEIPKERSYFALASQFATGNAMLYKSVFKKVGLFDRQFEKQRMGDGEFGMRVYLEGIKSVSNPLASCIDVKAGTGGLREMGNWDAFRPSNFFEPRPIPSVIYFFRRYFGKKATRLALLRMVPLSVLPYQFKKNKPMLVLGVFVSLLLTPLVVWQVWKSWKLAGEKLEEGALIDDLDEMGKVAAVVPPSQ